MPSEYNDPDADDDFAGFFGIDALPAQYGTDFDRRIVFVHNNHWRDPNLDALYADSIRVQPLFNDTTSNYFDAWDAMVMEPNFDGMDPGLTNYAEISPAYPEHGGQYSGSQGWKQCRRSPLLVRSGQRRRVLRMQHLAVA